ncbi:hypothetical protein HHI36_003532 [Cryptolaemus montrouzieri]|uniref:Tudor domain-containing protein n=1 Tax=Cryptolaemus montrouzieri TaxID=559131 RepID=A0ABD2PEF0_9CUCU
MSMKEVFSSWSTDYVDIFGRNLNVMVDDEGSIFIPLQEVLKIGFHIFPRSNFNPMMVGKSMILREFQLYMLGAAREYMLSNSTHFDKDEILGTIEQCRQYLTNEEEDNRRRSAGLLGRTLLTNPAEINKTVKPIFQRLSGRLSDRGLSPRDESHISQVESSHPLRQPHHQSPGMPTNSSSVDSSNKPGNRRNTHSRDSSNDRKKKQNGLCLGQQKSKNKQNQSYDKSMFAPSAQFAARRDNSKSGSENGDVEFMRLSDCKVERIKLGKNSQKVKVVHVETSNEKEKYWVHLVDNEDVVIDIVQTCVEHSDKAPSISPKLGEICMALSIEDDLWYRVVVQRIHPRMKVHYIDFGNDAIVSEVRKLPKVLEEIPAQAVRITVSRPQGAASFHLQMDQIVSVKFMKQFIDETLLVSLEQTNNSQSSSKGPSKMAPAANFESIFMNRIKYSTTLKDKELVRIVAYSKGRFYLRNKEHHDKLRDIVNQVATLPREKLNSVEINQVVLCKKEDEEHLCRAIVRGIDDGVVTVQFIDFQTLDALSIKSLYNISRAIADMPVALIESPIIKGYDFDKFEPESELLIEQMISQRSKLNVQNNGEFDLILNDESFSDMLFPKAISIPDLSVKRSVKEESKPDAVPETSKAAPAQVKTAAAQPIPVANKVVNTSKTIVEKVVPKVMFEDMPAFVPPMGQDDYMLTTYKDCLDFTVTSTGDKESEMLARCSCIDIDDDVPYDPVDGEMVLARFEGGWFRGAVLDKLSDGRINIVFVEYGNLTEVTKEDVRRFPPELCKIPMMGIMCCMDFPDTDVVKKRLEELLKTENIYEINFISFDSENLIYKVEIPKINDVLKKEGLI